MIETKEKNINGSVYSVTQLPARRALRLQAKLAKMMAPFLAEIFISASTENDNLLPAAVKMLMTEIDDKTFDQFVMEMIAGVRKSGVELTASTVDMEFAGNLNELFLVLQFVLEVNFADFFQEGGILTTLIPQNKTKLTKNLNPA